MKRALVLVVIALQALVFAPAKAERMSWVIFAGRVPTFSTNPTAAPTRRAFLPGDLNVSSWPGASTWCPPAGTVLSAIPQAPAHPRSCTTMDRLYMSQGDTLTITNLDDRPHAIVSVAESCNSDGECEPLFYTPTFTLGGDPICCGTVAPTESLGVIGVEDLSGEGGTAADPGRSYSFYCSEHLYMTGLLRVYSGAV